MREVLSFSPTPRVFFGVSDNVCTNEEKKKPLEKHWEASASAFPAAFSYDLCKYLHIYTLYNLLKHQNSMCNFSSLKLLVTGKDCSTPAILKLCIMSITCGSTIHRHQQYHCNQQPPLGNADTIASSWGLGYPAAEVSRVIMPLGYNCFGLYWWALSRIGLRWGQHTCAFKQIIFSKKSRIRKKKHKLFILVLYGQQ